MLTVIPRTSPQDARTSALVQRIRDVVVPGAVAVTFDFIELDDASPA